MILEMGSKSSESMSSIIERIFQYAVRFYPDNLQCLTLVRNKEEAMNLSFIQMIGLTPYSVGSKQSFYYL